MKWINATGAAVQYEAKCAFPQYFSDSKCAMLFDYSDHIVLCIVQYILPILLEVGYIFCCRFPNFFTDKNEAIAGNGSASATHTGSGYWYFYVLSIFVALMQLALIWRMIIFTCLFFHTPAENIVAFLIGSAVVFFPLCATNTRIFYMKFYNGATNEQ